MQIGARRGLAHRLRNQIVKRHVYALIRSPRRRAAPTCICWGDGCVECPCCVATSMQRPGSARCLPMVDETLPRSPCLQRADERHTLVNALGRTSYTPQPKVPRGISEPRSVGARIPMPWAGFLLGARGQPANRPGLLFVVVGLNLLLLLDCGPLGILAIIRQPQPGLRHVR